MMWEQGYASWCDGSKSTESSVQVHTCLVWSKVEDQVDMEGPSNMSAKEVYCLLEGKMDLL